MNVILLVIGLITIVIDSMVIVGGLYLAHKSTNDTTAQFGILVSMFGLTLLSTVIITFLLGIE